MRVWMTAGHLLDTTTHHNRIAHQAFLPFVSRQIEQEANGDLMCGRGTTRSIETSDIDAP